MVDGLPDGESAFAPEGCRIKMERWIDLLLVDLFQGSGQIFFST